MASGMARLAFSRGQRVALGDGRKIIWHRNAYEIHRAPGGFNPNLVKPGDDLSGVGWIAHYPGNRPYCTLGAGRRWTFTPGLQVPGEMFFDTGEYEQAAAIATDNLVIIEPNTKHMAPNKQWPHERYSRVARLLAAEGYRVAQFVAGGVALAGIEQIRAGSFRVAAAILQRARLYVGPEGGLHHAAAAVGTQAVVIFGGYISPAVTGYAKHANLFSGEGLGCGNIDPCRHCRDAMAAITVDQVIEAARGVLHERSDEMGALRAMSGAGALE